MEAEQFIEVFIMAVHYNIAQVHKHRCLDTARVERHEEEEKVKAMRIVFIRVKGMIVKIVHLLCNRYEKIKCYV